MFLIESVFSYKNGKKENLVKDIALVKLERELTPMEATPLTPCTESDAAIEGEYTFIGMGETEWETGDGAETLQEVILKETKNGKCGIFAKPIESFSALKINI